MPRLAAPLLAVTLVAVSVAGCGGSTVETGGSRTGTVTSVAPVPDMGGSEEAPIGAGARSCDSDAGDVEALHATGVPCKQARRVMHGWQRQRDCTVPSGASRASCRTHSRRCQTVRTDRGLAVSCAGPGQSIAFIAKP